MVGWTGTTHTRLCDSARQSPGPLRLSAPGPGQWGLHRIMTPTAVSLQWNYFVMAQVEHKWPTAVAVISTAKNLIFIVNEPSQISLGFKFTDYFVDCSTQ